MAEKELQVYKSRMEGRSNIDANESEELEEVPAGTKIPSKTVKPGEDEDEQI